MTAQTDPYVRVYYRIIDDPKFLTVYDDDRRLSTWLRLLLTADATHPAPAPIPQGVNKAALAHLVEVGLVDLGTGGRYRIRGLTAERDRQSARGKAGADARWNANALPTQSERNASASEHALHSLRSAPLPPTPPLPPSIEGERDGLPHVDRETAALGEQITGHGFLTSGHRQMTELDRLIEDHGEAKVQAAMTKAAGGRQVSWRQLIWDSVKILEPLASSPSSSERKAEAGQDEAARARQDFERGVKETRKRNRELYGDQFPKDATDAA